MGKKKETKPYLSKKELGEYAILKCDKCEGVHFRHAGNVLTHRSYVRHDRKKVDSKDTEIQTSSHLVYICIGCGHPWIEICDELVDGEEFIDVDKFDAMNKALQADTLTDPHC